jgi:hypothetical protein
MTSDVVLFASSGISNAEAHFQNLSSKMKGASLPLWWSEVGEVDCPEVAGIKSKLLVTPVRRAKPIAVAIPRIAFPV